MKADWLLIVTMAVTVVGLIQFLKTARNWLPIPDWVWWIALPAVTVGVVVAVFYGPGWVIQVGLVLALAQLGYEGIIQFVKRKIETM